MSVDQVVLPLISPCLSQEECVTQSFIILEKFKKEFGDFITSINKQIDFRTEKLSKIKTRITTVNEKINNVNNSKKAIQIYSPASFPQIGATPRNDFIVNTKSALSVDFKYKLINESMAPLSTTAVTSPAASFDLFYQRLKPPNISEGIGIPPRDMTSAGNLLIYNTSINPYKNYVMVDPLNVSLKTKPKIIQHEPAQAPETLALGHQFNLLQRLNFDYNPILGNVPQIEVPDSLPVLSGIVTDLKYSADENELGIAPSIILTDITVDLPDLDSEVIDSMLENPNITSVNVPVLTSTPTPDPQPRSTPTPSTVASTPDIPLIPPSAVKPEEPISHSEPIIKQEENNSKPAAPEENRMKSLFDSIVKAGGSDQFKFKERAEEKPKPAQPPKEVDDPNDVMSQLKKVLKRRGESLKGVAVVPDLPKPSYTEQSPLIRSLSMAIKSDGFEVEEDDENWSD